VDGRIDRYEIQATHGGLLATAPLGEIGPVLATAFQETK
jgi:hypothetical protein